MEHREMKEKYQDMANSIIGDYDKRIAQLEARESQARAIMQKFVGKVDRGMARSVETYAEMKEWLDD